MPANGEVVANFVLAVRPVPTPASMKGAAVSPICFDNSVAAVVTAALLDLNAATTSGTS